MAEKVFEFDHEEVHAVTIDGVTYMSLDDLIPALQGRIAQEMVMGVTGIGAMGEDGDPQEAILSLMETMAMTEGKRRLVNLIASLSAHFTNVSERLQAGLPAHEDEEVDAAVIDAQVDAFAETLDDDLARLLDGNPWEKGDEA